MPSSKTKSPKRVAAKPPKHGSAKAAPAAAAKPKAVTKATPAVAAKSVAKAKAAFANFSLSKPAGAPAKTLVAPGADPAAAHRKIMADSLLALPKPTQDTPATRQFTLALSPATLKTLLPSLNTERQAVSAADVVKALTTYSRGTQFMAQGNATLRRLALQTEVDRIMAEIKGSAK